jgi:hypothetical protein
MVSGHLEGGQHQRGRLHLADTKASNAQYLTLEGHFVSQQVSVPRVDVDSVAAHRKFDLIDDALTSGLNSQNISCFQNMVRRSVTEVNTWRPHDIPESVPLNQ